MTSPAYDGWLACRETSCCDASSSMSRSSDASPQPSARSHTPLSVLYSFTTGTARDKRRSFVMRHTASPSAAVSQLQAADCACYRGERGQVRHGVRERLHMFRRVMRQCSSEMQMEGTAWPTQIPPDGTANSDTHLHNRSTETWPLKQRMHEPIHTFNKT